MSRNLFQYAGAVAGSRPGDSVRILTTAPTKGPEVPDRGLLVADCVTVEGRVFARGQMSLDASGHPPRFYGPDGATSLVILGADGVSTTTITSTSDPLSGSGSGGSSSASLTRVAPVTAATFTAAASTLIPVDTTSNSSVGTIPTGFADKAQVLVKHVLRGGTNTVTVNLSGTDVINRAGGVQTLALPLLGQYVLLQYDATAGIFTIIGEGISLTQQDLRFHATINDRTAWAAATAYAKGDRYTDPNGLRRDVVTAYTSGATFGATDTAATAVTGAASAAASGLQLVYAGTWPARSTVSSDSTAVVTWLTPSSVTAPVAPSVGGSGMAANDIWINRAASV